MPETAGHTLLFQVTPREGGKPHERRVRLLVDGAEKAVGDVSFDLGLATLPIEAIQRGTATQAQVRNGGLALWERLRAGAIAAALEPLREEGAPLSLRLDLPPQDEALPWEAMHDDRRTPLAASAGHVVIRHPRGAPPARHPGPRTPPLSVLIVVPAGSRLQVDAEIPAIEEHFVDRGVAIAGGRPRVLQNRVTRAMLRDELRAKVEADGAPYDVVHFIGHGKMGTDGAPVLVLNAEDGARPDEMPPVSLIAMFDGRPPRLVVLNACQSGSAAEAKGLAGFGQELLSAGVSAVVAMQQAIRNDLAIQFADAFYGELARTGRVDQAVTAGRLSLVLHLQADTAAAFTIPVLFSAPGAEALFSPAPGRAAAAAAARPAPAAASLPLPETLISAVRDGWCIPVVGPGLVTPTRDPAGLPWTPGAIARALAGKEGFGEPSTLAAMTQLPERLDHLVLQRVCQHVERRRQRRPLIAEIKAALSRTTGIPNAYDQLSSWPVPGYVCTHFDGLLSRALSQRGRAFRQVTRLDADAPAQADRIPLVVHLRGTILDEKNPCLTEVDHDRLLDAMAEMDRQTSAVAGLVTAEAGRCLLLLGTTAWDPWLRRLLWCLIPADSREHNRLFIAQPRPTDADSAAWSGFSTEWIDAAPEDVVAALTAALEPAKGAP